MPGRKILGFVVLLIIFQVLLFPELIIYKADTFSAYSTSEYSGWYWCDNKDAYLEWYWFPIRNLPEIFYINFHLKMSNKVDGGGSGFSSQEMVAILLTGEMDEKVLKRSIFRVYNPFPVKFTGDSEGLGQDVYGSVEFQVDEKEVKILRNEGLRIRLIWPPLDNRNVFSASESVKPVLAFVR
ncbi:MAG: hypothetical protein J7K69_07290 [Thermotogae bacterium]|nr:hypothetical protein [Thermotogota bacterium]